MTIGSRAADAPVRSTAEAVNKDKRDLPILVMFADVCKNERRELKTTDGVKVARKKVRIAAAVSKKRQEGASVNGKKRRMKKHEPTWKAISRAAGGVEGRTGGLRGSTLPNQSESEERGTRMRHKQTLTSCVKD